MVQLLPDRALTITRRGREVQVVLEGVGPAGPRPNRVDVFLEHAAVRSRAVEKVELIAFDDVGGGAITWQAVPGQTGQGGLGASIALQLPDGLDPLRVRVREVELVGTADPDPGTIAGLGELRERVVFTETTTLEDI